MSFNFEQKLLAIISDYCTMVEGWVLQGDVGMFERA